MLTIGKAVFLGVLQGVTEWLPISSSGHLVIAQHFLKLGEQISFDLLIHLGTLFVVLFIFWKDISRIWLALLSYFHNPKQSFLSDPYRRLFVIILVGSVPTAVIGLLLRDQIERAFNNLLMVGIAYIITAVILFATKYTNPHKNIRDLSYIDALIIGTFQGLAIFPGVSRSGTTISAGLLRGVDRDLAARISFLMFIPAIAGAVILNAASFTITKNEVVPMLSGLFAAIVVSYIFIEILLALVRRRKFYYFAYYCFVLGVILLVYVALQPHH